MHDIPLPIEVVERDEAIDLLEVVEAGEPGEVRGAPLWPWLFVAALAASAAAGCASLEVGYEGRCLAAPLPLWPEGKPPERLADGRAAVPPFAYLSADHEGNLALGEERLEVPSVREDERLGVVLVDLDALPRPWRPWYARGGGVMVSAIESGSPLAIAGLLPFDVIRAVGGAEVEGPGDALARMLAVEPGGEIRIEAVKRTSAAARLRRLEQALGGEVPRTSPAGSSAEGSSSDGPEALAERARREQDEPVRAEVRASAVEAIDADGGLWVPFLFGARWARDGHAVRVGPWDLLFHYRTDRDAWQRPAEEAGAGEFLGYTDEVGWSALLGLVGYRRARVVGSGTEQSELRLFWLIPIRWGGDRADGADARA